MYEASFSASSEFMSWSYEALRVFGVLTILCLSFLSCRATHQEKNSQNDSKPGLSQKQIVPLGEMIPPNKCRLVGTIVAIDSGWRSAKTDEPCSKVPCRSTVRVDSIIGYGQGFPGVLSRSDEIPVKFVFTLGSTKDLFPNMSEFYPGLRVGSTFTADIEGSIAPAIDKVNVPAYQVYGYKVKETNSR